MNIICILATFSKWSEQILNEAISDIKMYGSFQMSLPLMRMPVAWMQFGVQIHSRQFLPEGGCRDTRQCWCELFFVKMIQVHQQSTWVGQFGHRFIGMKLFGAGVIPRLLCEIMRTHCQGSLLAWGFPHLWCRDLDAIPGHWPSDGVVGCAWDMIALIKNSIWYQRKCSRQSQCVYSCQKLWFQLIDIFF